MGSQADLEEQKKAAPFELNETDLWVLSQTDEEFHFHSWDELRDIIACNNLSILKRKPSDLRRYIAWSQSTVAAYGSITNFIIQERLHWTPPFTHKSSIPFANTEDYRILRNDWPYGLDPEITHIVVWSKTPIETDPETGDLTEGSRKVIADFVTRTFVDTLKKEREDAEERVVWFKNWAKLQSVRALEHVHVLVRGASEELLEEWTGEKKRL